MAEGTFSDTRVEVWLGDFKTLWVGLHYDNPRTAGEYASEVFGGSYARVRTTMSDPVNRVIFNESDLSFNGLPAVKLTHIAGWSQAYNGTMEFSVPLPAPRVIVTGKGYYIPAGEIAITIP